MKSSMVNCDVFFLLLPTVGNMNFEAPLVTDMSLEAPQGVNRFNEITKGWQQNDDENTEVRQSSI